MRIIRCLLVLGLVTGALRAAEGFSNRLSPEESVQAGLGKLTAAERAALDALVQKYGGPGMPEPAPRPAPSAPVERPVVPAPTAPVAAATPPPVVTPPAEAPAKKSFLRRAKKDPAAAKTEAKPAANVIESEIDGSFTGWEETTVWTLKDGSIWRVDNRPRPYFTGRISNPKVKITPALMNGFWLEIPELDVRVRVVRIR
jgi:hypothetical protein